MYINPKSIYVYDPVFYGCHDGKIFGVTAHHFGSLISIYLRLPHTVGSMPVCALGESVALGEFPDHSFSVLLL